MILTRRKIIRYDFILLALTVGLVVCGILFIYSSGVDSSGNLRSSEYIRQIIWGVIGVVALVVFSLIDYRVLRGVAFYSYIFSVALLIFVLFFGREVNGARSWIGIGSLGVQPSELAKLTTILYTAHYLERKTEHIHTVGVLARSGCILLIPFLLTLVQPDLGTAAVYIPIFLIMSFVAGATPRHLLFLLLIGLSSLCSLIVPEWLFARAVVHGQPVPLIARNNVVTWALIIGSVLITGLAHIGWSRLKKSSFYWIRYAATVVFCSLPVSLFLRALLQDYQLKRLIIFIDPFLDPKGAGWNVIQSLTAVGSGGLFGKGFLQGSHSHSNYLPQQSTDFIFSILSEEWGFVGGAVVFALFGVIILRGIGIINDSSDTNMFGVLVGAGIVAVILAHFTVNVGMAMGIMPVTGIPLLFLSHGGSSLLSAMSMVGILMSIHLYRERLG